MHSDLTNHPGKPAIPTVLLGLSQLAGETREELVLWKRFENHEFFVKHEYSDAPRWDWIILDANSSPTEFGEAVTFEAAEMALAEAAFKLFAKPGAEAATTKPDPAQILRDQSQIPPDVHHCHACMAIAALERLCRTQ